MGEFTEFAEALLDQISVEIDEEKEISQLAEKINDNPEFPNQFTELESFSKDVLSEISKNVEEFTGYDVKSDLKVEFPNLKEFKLLKGRKVFATKQSRKFVDDLFLSVADLDVKNIAELIEKDTEKFLVYSTYAKSYISKISTTYGDYLDSCIYLNKFILSNYPKIILYKQGQPYDSRKEQVESGYKGALKMTIVEEVVHSTQDNLQEINKNAATNVNSINEELANIVLKLGNNEADNLYEYLQLQTVPDNFPIAKKANLFFMLNPDNFVVNVLGPDVMTYSHVEIDPKISEIIPELPEIYQRWLQPIQEHHAAFSTMEGMAEFTVQNLLQNDDDFQNYLTTFMGMDFSSYKVRKNMGKELTEKVFEKFGKDAFRFLNEKPPGTRELKEPDRYLKRDLSTGSEHM